MLRALPLLIGLAVGATSAFAELTDDEAGTIRCAATALVLHTALASYVEAGADFDERFLAIVDRASIDLLHDAQPLFAEGQEGNAEMTREIDALVAEEDTAIADGNTAEWMQETADAVRVCHMASLDRQEAAE